MNYSTERLKETTKLHKVVVVIRISV